MFGGIRLARALRGLGWATLVWLCAGCQPAAPLSRAGVTLAPPALWNAVDRRSWTVPGTPLAAWAGPEGASLVVYRSLLIPDGSAEGLAHQVATRLTNLPGVTLLDQRVVAVSGHQAARVELTGTGTGAALAPSGTGKPIVPDGREPVQTRRILVAIPRRADTLMLVWHVPVSYEHPDRLVDDVLTTVRLADPPPTRSTY